MILDSHDKENRVQNEVNKQDIHDRENRLLNDKLSQPTAC